MGRGAEMKVGWVGCCDSKERWRRRDGPALLRAMAPLTVAPGTAGVTVHSGGGETPNAPVAAGRGLTGYAVGCGGPKP